MDKLMAALQKSSDIDRFWGYVDKGSDDNSCWLWTGRSLAGYGRLRISRDGKRIDVQAHRISYALAHGMLDQSLVICHKCDNPPCVNPAHLFAGTHADNQHDKFRKGRQASTAGELHAAAKLREPDVLFMRYAHSVGVPPKLLASAYGVSLSTTYAVVSRRGWSHI